jgi:hypothetical protein
MCHACTAVSELDEATSSEFMQRMLDIINSGAIAVMTGIGHRTGLFDAMADGQPRTSDEIAKQASLAERYVREWLGTMVTGRIVHYEAAEKTYRLPAEHASFLTRAASPNNLAVTVQWIGQFGASEDLVTDAACSPEGLDLEADPGRRGNVPHGGPSRPARGAAAGALLNHACRCPMTTLSPDHHIGKPRVNRSTRQRAGSFRLVLEPDGEAAVDKPEAVVVRSYAGRGSVKRSGAVRPGVPDGHVHHDVRVVGNEAIGRRHCAPLGERHPREAVGPRASGVTQDGGGDVPGQVGEEERPSWRREAKREAPKLALQSCPVAGGPLRDRRGSFPSLRSAPSSDPFLSLRW